MASRVGYTPWGSVLRAALLLAAVTTIVFAVELFRDPSDTEDAPVLTVIWVAVLALAAPLTAYAMNRRHPIGTDPARALGLAAPQLPLLVLLVSFDVWLDVRSGYLLAGSGEEAMSYGIGTTVAAVFGLIVVALVALAARWGSTPKGHESRAALATMVDVGPARASHKGSPGDDGSHE